MLAGGGTYTLQGNTYTEHIEYFPMVSWIGLSLPFTCRTEGERFIQSGVLPVFEAGRRVGEQRMEEIYRRLDAPHTAADVQAVAKAVRSYGDAWLANDVAAITSHLDENAVISVPPQPDIKGRAAARELWGKVLATSKVKKLTLREDPITVSGDLAVVPGEFDETVEVQGQTEPTRLNGRYLAIWLRGSDGAWRILRFMAVERTGSAQ
jgi:ketosteroid isomerase-like protein